ncbi:MAG TPA: polysaccharide lyase [Polyangiaceae bacterium]|nr:polysaccharide lyase [Polyangiaceae bacterium]
MLVAVATLLTGRAHAELLFHGDFETGDLKQWGYLLNEDGLSVVSEPVADGTHAGKVQITKDNLWSNGLNRVEVQYKPPAAQVSDGAESFYGYSFNVPEALSADNHQVLYWETDSTYQQVMHVAIEGQKMYFATQKPSFTKHWEQDGAATPGKWHRLVMRVKWSADAATGEVDLWFDGQKVVDAAKAQTYLGNPAFVQHGILRQPTIDKVETLYMDDARFGTTLDDVKGSVPSGSGGGGGVGGGSSGGAAGGLNGASGGSSGGGASGGEATSGAAGSGASGGVLTNGGASPGGAAAAGAASVTTPARKGDSSCAVSAVGPSSRGALSALLSALAAGCWWRRRSRKALLPTARFMS